MTIKLLTEHHLEFLSLTRDCTGSSESILVKMPHCSKSHVAAQLYCINCMLYSVTVTITFPTVAASATSFLCFSRVLIMLTSSSCTFVTVWSVNLQHILTCFFLFKLQFK